MDRLLEPLVKENSLPHLATIKKNLVEKCRQKYDSERYADKVILKRELEKVSDNGNYSAKFIKKQEYFYKIS